jgi:gamma-glutamylcyclotransferase (GGCT)/AIG2-like uncharacterized protein YtfP
MPLLFSYGTLQQEAVQLATFGRRLEGEPDDLPGFERSRAGAHENARFTGRREDRVSGMAFEVTEAELAAADEYEKQAAYKRIEATLASAKRVWLYVKA